MRNVETEQMLYIRYKPMLVITICIMTFVTSQARHNGHNRETDGADRQTAGPTGRYASKRTTDGYQNI